MDFDNFAVSKQKDPHYTDELNKFIKGQKRVYVRIGLEGVTKLRMVVTVIGFK